MEIRGVMTEPDCDFCHLPEHRHPVDGCPGFEPEVYQLPPDFYMAYGEGAKE